METDWGQGRVEALWLKRAKRGPMDPVGCAVLEVGRGLRGNADRGGRRQVTLISAERWAELMRNLGSDLDPSSRRANVMLAGVDLQHSRGRLLRIGEALLRINGETRPCEQMEEARSGLQALMRDRWGGGAFAEVIDGGTVRVGDRAGWHVPLDQG